jgi:hypothetical protein
VSDPTTGEPESVTEARALLDFHFFPAGEGDDEYLRADAFRENAIRLVVFDTHLAIDELLRSLVFDALAEQSSIGSERRVGYVQDLASRQALDLALQLGVVSVSLYKKLRDLNTLRNRAAHHWELDQPMTHRSGGATRQHPLTWKGRRLTPELVRTGFSRVYGEIYSVLLERWRDSHPLGGDLGGAVEPRP